MNASRRTLIQEEKKAVAEIRIVDEPVTVVVSLKGWVRTMKGHEVDPASLAFKAGDGSVQTIAEQDLSHKVLSRFTPGEPLIVPGLKPGESRQSTVKIEVYDLSDLEKSLYMHSGGQSGNILSEHYKAFSEAWAKNEYIPMRAERRTLDAEPHQLLKLVPAR